MAFVFIPLIGFTSISYGLYNYYYEEEKKDTKGLIDKVDNNVVEDVKKIHKTRVEGKNITGIKPELDLMTELKQELKRRRLFIE